jgi:SAM-dependent methyltransferase
MDEQSETIAAYDAHAAAFDERFERHFREYNLAHADAFLEALPGRLVLDIGSGGGNHAAYFASKGCKVLCADPSEAMVALCRRRKLRAVQARVQTFEWVAKFHGIWANACLLHLRKAELPDALARLDRYLMPGGVMGCSVKEGEGERMETHERFQGARRLFSYWSDAEFRALFTPRFELLRFERTVSSARTVFLKYLFRKGAA